MKQEYNKVLKSLFIEKIKSSIPQATIWREKSDFIFPGESVFSLGNYLESTTFIIIIPNIKEDKFTVELAWSTKGKFPELSVRPNDSLIKPREADEFSIRLSSLIDKAPEFWSVSKPVYTDALDEILANMKKLSNEDAIADLTPLVDDCMGKLLEFGIPFFRSNTRIK